eukprot:CAMPEP_0177619704 /NCGR_PEP_ID=MMETSP0419_2-20121207/26433_1 /TAXON_ID=582737 /ORGANISM="Tetraselmis sp., Strain GSL018" /LENGTH=225 /DNA_ID=CAMNT_0019119051 /DNA_START=465 /DNA_END=1139 /DNA_ORIENTATION=-
MSALSRFRCSEGLESVGSNLHSSGKDESKEHAPPRGANEQAATYPRGAPGEIRERIFSDLPESHLYIGRTTLSLQDIRNYNKLQNSLYKLNANDCRHYVNNLVQYTTGYEAASSSLVNHNLVALRGGELGWDGQLLKAAKELTDVNNWPTVKSLGQGSLAAAGIFLGRLSLVPVVRLLPLSVLPGLLFSRQCAADRSRRAAGALTATVRQGRLCGAGEGNSVTSW